MGEKSDKDATPHLTSYGHILLTFELKGSYDAISSFAFSLECYKLIVHR